MMIELSDADFERLLKLAYLGEIVMNDWTPPEAWTDEQRAASDLVLDLQARAADSPLTADLVGQDTRTGEWLPSPLMREEMEPYIERYDDETFWDELVQRLARRDLAKEYGAETLSQMTDAHRAEAEKPLMDYYHDEMDAHGLERLGIDEG